MDSLYYFKKIMGNESNFQKLVLHRNVDELLKNSVKNYKNNVCVQWSNGQKTYNDLFIESNALAVYLNSIGVKKGDVICFHFFNDYDFIVSFFACAKLGAICALLPFSLPEEALIKLSHLFNYKKVLTNSLLTKDFSTSSSLEIINISQIDLSKKDDVKVNIDDNDPLCIVFTGGTTGNPKGALLSHRNVCRGALNGCYVIGNPFNHKFFSLIPFTHIFGLIKNLLTCLMTGSTLYTCINPTAFVKEAALYNPDTMVLTPGLASMVLGLMKLYSPKLLGTNFNTIICGGANVPPSLVNEFLKFNINCCPGYGLTEASNMVSGNGSITTKPDSVGMPFPGQEFKLIDNELLIKGDNVFLGYYNNKVETEKILKDGWLYTGDIARFDEEGFLYILGRKNNLIVLPSGLKIIPEEIESLILDCSLVKDVIVKKNNDNDLLFADVLLVNKTNENEIKVREYILNTVNSKINEGAPISVINFRDQDFKRTPAMKIIR